MPNDAAVAYVAGSNAVASQGDGDEVLQSEKGSGSCARATAGISFRSPVAHFMLMRQHARTDIRGRIVLRRRRRQSPFAHRNTSNCARARSDNESDSDSQRQRTIRPRGFNDWFSPEIQSAHWLLNL